MSLKFLKPHEIGNMVEQQVQQWRMWQDIQHKHEAQAKEAGVTKINYITVSRELGSGGDEIAENLSRRMEWQLYDKEILNYMSENLDVHVKAVESVDEQTIGWINDWLMPVFTMKSGEHVEQLRYYRHLGKVLMVIARHGKAIIMGRAAGLLLPRDKGLSVRITAPFELRCDRFAQANHISMDEARLAVKKSDENQNRFVKNFLQKNIEDTEHYDIICNTEKLTPEAVAKIIWRALDERLVSQQEQVRMREEGTDIAEIVKQQMDQWEGKKGQEGTEAQLAGGAKIDYITISRETGSGGVEIAQMLADLMHWQMFDKEILDYMSNNMKVHVKMLTSVDERTRSWIGERLVSMLARKNKNEHIKQLRYYEHLGAVLLVIAQHRRAIIVGRAAGQVLPKEKGLRIMVTAPFDLRCRRYAREHGLNREEAITAVKKADKEKSRFLKDFVGKKITDVQTYDVVINTEKLYPNSVAKLIWRTLDQRTSSEQEQT